MKHRKQTLSQAGFTLVEVIVVLAVILLLAGIAVPMVDSYIKDAQRARAKSEVKILGAAIMSFYKDLGVYPARNSSGTDNTLRILGTGPTVPASNPFTNSTTWNSWLTNASYGDTFDNHLLENMPQGSAGQAYPVTGERRWYGPYLADTAPVDPWGRPYLIMMFSFFSTDATNYKKVILLSAGADGAISTSPNCTATTEIAGDDIGMVLSRRQ